MRSPIRLLLNDRRVAAWTIGAVGCATLAMTATIGWLLLMVTVVDDMFLGGRALSDVSDAVGVMVVLLAGRAVAMWLGEMFSLRASTRLRSTVRASLIDHLVAVGPAIVAGSSDDDQTAVTRSNGQLTTAVGSGVEALDPFVARFVPAAAMVLIGPLLVGAAVTVIDPWSTLILLFTGPMLVLLLAVIGGRTRSLTRRRFDELGWLASFYLDMIRGLGTLKVFGRSHDGAATIESVSRRFGDTTMDVLRTAFQTSLVMEWAATAATALVAVAVSFRMVEGSMSFRAAFAVLVLTPEFFVPFRRLALEYHAGQSGRAAADQIETLEALPAIAARRYPDSVRAPRAQRPLSPPAIRMNGVGFRYPGASADALADFDLSVAPGETVALCGPSGAGKSTVARVLLGFVEPSAGTVEIGGSFLGSTDIEQWRKQIAWVPQSPTLIAGTVAANIALGDPNASHERVVAAARLARADGFIGELPDGYDTVIGERGVGLSGGQRQRLAIARAALIEAPFVLLDEFTTHLDERTEAELLEAMRELLESRTALVIAHRPATIAMADRVVNMAGGRIEGRSSGGGNGQELIEGVRT